MRLWTRSPMQRSPSLGTNKNTNNMPPCMEIGCRLKIPIYQGKMMLGDSVEVREMIIFRHK